MAALLEVRDLTKHFPVGGGALSAWCPAGGGSCAPWTG